MANQIQLSHVTHIPTGGLQLCVDLLPSPLLRLQTVRNHQAKILPLWIFEEQSDGFSGLLVSLSRHGTHIGMKSDPWQGTS